FGQYTKRLQMESSLRIEDLAKLTDGYSGSDVKDICQSVQLRVVDELFQSGKGLDNDASTRSITESDFREILKMRKPSVSIDMIRAYARWSEQFKAL
ncbi:MAG TPA: AAA family ATPase, partial [Nitrososphaeraceae archaeon]|nr:AAA family ATPase [Nitrososphaeraceae archaeon]